jgi:hypothetical protein
MGPAHCHVGGQVQARRYPSADGSFDPSANGPGGPSARPSPDPASDGWPGLATDGPGGPSTDGLLCGFSPSRENVETPGPLPWGLCENPDWRAVAALYERRSASFSHSAVIDRRYKSRFSHSRSCRYATPQSIEITPHPDSPPPLPSPRGEGRGERGERVRGFGRNFRSRLLGERAAQTGVSRRSAAFQDSPCEMPPTSPRRPPAGRSVRAGRPQGEKH